jgi:hypothetical protein
MDLRRLGPGEWLAGASGVALLVSLFLPWYDVGLPSVPAGSGWTAYAPIDATLSGWEALSAIDVVLALVAACGVLVAVVTAVQSVPAVPIALSALVFLAGCVGVILVLIRLVDLPDFAGGRAWGLWLGLAGALGIVAGCVIAMRDEIRPGALEPDIDVLPAPRP